MIEIEISRCLYESGWKPFSANPVDRRLRIKRQGEKFSTLTELKSYYQIERLIKTGEKGWAISPGGKRHEWDIYRANISTDYILKP
jgi:hypothetical protein